MPSMLTLHLVLLNVLKVVQTLREQKVMPLISNDFNDETVPGSEMASHLELRETRSPLVHTVDDVDGKHLEQSFRELEVTEELLAKAKKATELQGGDFCSNGTWHLSGHYKAQSRLVSSRLFSRFVLGCLRSHRVTTRRVTKEMLFIGKPCNITADRVTLFLEDRLVFHWTVHFHGDLAVVALRPLRAPCVQLGDNAFVEPDAVLRLAGCQNDNPWYGGAMLTAGDGFGGAMYVRGNLDVRGELHIRDSWAKNSGGAIYLRWGSFTQSDGTLTITNASAERSGGAIYVMEGSFTQSGGNLTITDASSESDGGAIYVHKGSFTQLGGNLTITDASAKSDGGAMWIGGKLTMKKSKLSITHATAKIGGGIWVGGDGLFEDAVASFNQCYALEDGGGIRAVGDVDAVNTSLTFNSLIATSGHGAALVAKNLTQCAGDMVILNSSAGQDIISVSKWTTDTASAVRLEDCTSETFLISVQQGAALDGKLSSNNCSGTAGTLVSRGPVKLRNAIFNKTSSPQVRAPVFEGSNWNVTGTETWISGTVSSLHKIDCDQVFAGVVNEYGGGCRTCDPGLTFVKHEGVTIGSVKGKKRDLQQCRKCPEGASICNATAIQMSPGLMVDQSDISRPYHCPNPLACPGGLLSADESTPMCTKGYRGIGCNTCATDFARTDSNIFICTECAKDILWKIKEALMFVCSDAVIFAISAAGVITAQRRNKTSAVFLNQLMAFAAVTAPALLALSQTKTFKEKDQMRQVMFAASIPVQVGDTGESTTAASTECVLTYLGLQPSLVLAHVLSLAVYLMLALVLTIKSGWRVAVVVTINCFMPKFCAAFGRYLTCYRMEPASEKDQMQCILEDHFLPGMAISIAAIALCFLAGPGSWVRMIRDKDLTEEPQVLYLTRSYQSGYETWEVEKLIRKMLLKLISTTLPITLNPFSQMAFFSLVLTASALLHSSYRPYSKGEWNQAELSLLSTALVVVILTTLCLAKDIHWARSDELQMSLIVLVTGLVTLAGGLQSVFLVRELIQERRPPEQTENEDASKS